MTLAARITALSEAAPRRYARWSEASWRLYCEGPATRLWDGLSKTATPEAGFEDYLRLVREAVGLRYVSAATAADLDPLTAPSAGFLNAVLVDVLPRLLPTATAEVRAKAMSLLWNAGERLQTKPQWINRYLAARLPELSSLDAVEEFLARIVIEGFDASTPSGWIAPYSWASVDLGKFDRGFVPGTVVFVTPTIACVLDRRLPDRAVAILLRKPVEGGPLVLGTTPVLEAGAEKAKLSREIIDAMIATDPKRLPELREAVASPAGYFVWNTPYSQRIWIAAASR